MRKMKSELYSTVSETDQVARCTDVARISKHHQLTLHVILLVTMACIGRWKFLHPTKQKSVVQENKNL